MTSSDIELTDDVEDGKAMNKASATMFQVDYLDDSDTSTSEVLAGDDNPVSTKTSCPECGCELELKQCTTKDDPEDTEILRGTEFE